MNRFFKSYKHNLLSLIMVCIGLAILVWGLLQQGSSSRTNAQDDFSWLMSGVGIVLLSAGSVLPFWKLRYVIIVSILSPVIGFAVLIILFWGAFIISGISNVHHQDFAKYGMKEIQPALQMNELYAECNHSIVYTTRESVSTWNATAYFGGRYELSMQVPVSIESKTKGKVIGEARFYLHEMEAIDSTGRGVSYSRQLEFGLQDWEKVYKANGDFGVIGFTVNTKPPLKGFNKHLQLLRR